MRPWVLGVVGIEHAIELRMNRPQARQRFDDAIRLDGERPTDFRGLATDIHRPDVEGALQGAPLLVENHPRRHGLPPWDKITRRLPFQRSRDRNS